MSYKDIGEKLDEAAQLIAQYEPDQWSSWITYLMEILDNGDDFESVLLEVQNDIKIRLDEKRW